MTILQEFKTWWEKDKIKLDPTKNYCLDCGACCAHFVVNFPKKESSVNGGWVPIEFTQKFDKDRMNMLGRKKFKGEPCIALKGKIGEHVSCSIYENRPSVCREFPVMSSTGVQNPRCRSARKAKGLPPDLKP